MILKFIINIVCFLFIAGYPENGDAETVPRPVAVNKEISLVMGFDTETLADVEIDEKAARTAVDLWLAMLARKISLVGTTCFYKTSEKIITDLNNGRLDMIVTNPLRFLRLTEKADLLLAYTNVQHAKKTHKYLLVVRSDSGFTGISDLKDKDLAIKSKDEIGHLIINNLLLRNHSEYARRHFRSIRARRKYSQAVLAVFFGQAHACLTTDTVFSTMTELNPQVGRRLRIIFASPEIVNNVSAFRKDYPEHTREIVKNEVFGLKNTAYGRQVLMLFKAEEMAAASEADLDSLKAILAEYERLKKKP